MSFTEFRRALALDAIGPALLARAEWLPRGARQAVADAVLAAVEPELQQLREEVERQIDAKVGITGQLGNALADKTAAESQLAALKRAHVALAEQAGKDQARLARVARLADEYPAGIDTALIHAALDGQDPS